MRNSTLNRESKASDIMTKRVEIVFMTDALHDVANLFSEKNIGAAAVINKRGTYVGVITKTDLVRYEDQRDENKTILKKERSKTTEEYERRGFRIIDEDTVEHWMTPVILSMKPETPMGEIARRMVKYGIHHIFVRNKAGSLLGIVSSFDILRRVGATTPLADKE